MSANLFDLIRAAAPNLEKMAMESPDGLSLTYGELFERSGCAAHALIALGVEPGDRVAVQIDKSPDMIVVVLACLRAGAVLLPLNVAYTLAELEYFLSDAKPALVLCRPVALEAMRTLAEKLALPAVESLGASRDGGFADRIAAAPTEFATVPRAADDLAAILYTSGTTGRSKGAMLTHDNLASNALTLIDVWRFTSADVLIHALPVFHTHGLFVATNVALLSGATMIFQPRFDPDAIVAALPRATSLMGVPTFYVRLVEHEGVTRQSTAHMRLFVSGSAPLLAETHAAWRGKTGHAILERYGMTETNMIASNPYDGERRAGTVGFPLPGVSLRIAEPETGKALAQGEIGVIEVKGPNVFKGYWLMPEKTAEEFRADGFFITGDLAKIDEQGYVNIVGRAKDLIISGGFNVYPIEIEAEIDALEGVAESAVIGLPHPDFGEGVTAVVVSKPEALLSETAVIAALERRLARYKLPKRVFFVESLPRNAMGKVQKKALRDAHEGLYG
ncbi:malonyl-CoA synthase [Methylocapsa sp. S129]|uniref:malonate--CoA ligase n=1 Tax=Methylocapsa sp. S129 TaxID=1641869 RepID=UPI00131C6657|nr:malonyl-CoA synthase [Methylocapsa sp. S129]